MIPSSQSGKGLALGLAVAGHAALALTLIPRQEVLIEGRAGATEAAIGSSFSDMVAGRMTPEAPEAVIEPQAELTPIAPAAAVETVRPVKTDRVEQPQLRPPAAPVPAEAAAPTPALDAPPPRPEPRRIAATAPREKIGPEPERKPAAQPAPRGNSERTARTGQASGSARANAASSGRGGASAEAGNTAVSNYPGLVMRKLARVPKPRVSSRGATVIAFRIASGGGLSAASVAHSSGSSALDQAALRLVRRAAPFPAPPHGAQRSFSIRIEGR